MQRVLDGKSVAVGLFVGAALVAGLGATQNAAVPGRYQMETEATIDSHNAREYKVFVLDTATGDVWNSPFGQRPPRGT